jgi:alpha-tubulin suppressor-like RCC1 family protein
MASEPTGFTFADLISSTTAEADFDDVYLRRSAFLDTGLWSTGCNVQGNIGDNTTVSKSSPVQTISGGSTWKAVGAGVNWINAIKKDGTLWSWGNGANGRLGTGTATTRSSPTQESGAATNWKVISSALQGSHALGIRITGDMYAWGLNSSGQIGDNATVQVLAPKQVGNVTPWKAVSAGGSFTIALACTGALWVWGADAAGQLGDNSTIDKSSPVQVGTDLTWKSVSSGLYHTVAVKTDGTLWTWGCGANGRLGVGDTLNRSSPAQVGSSTDWKKVAAGGSHSFGLKCDGSLWAFGLGTGGELGNLTASTGISSPVQTADGGKDWRDVKGGVGISAGIKGDGSLWSWGCGTGGRTGHGDTLSRSTPTQVGASTNWVAIGASCFLTGLVEDTW